MSNLSAILRGRRLLGRRFHSRQVSVEQTARLAQEWGAVEVRRQLDETNQGPFVGLGPTQ